ncbi:MAG: lipopolysaccharide biosynthesis protein RfbH [Candidatus Omnitrophota bacterium]|nr:lipopolysaccharide biosynthesis protein RfbH [Candidatus Omnitrophota bacterium]
MRKQRFIPYKTKIQYAGPFCDKKDINAMIQSIKKGWFGVGKSARKFEEEFARFLGVKEVIVVNSGSSANLLSLAALNFNHGSEVITSACTFPTAFNPIIQNNLVPVVVDIKLDTYNIDPDLIEQAISDKTKALMLVHNLGNPCEMDKIMKIARKYDLTVIEDNCDALGSIYDGKLTGTFGDISTSSFYVAHHITMGEGGAVCTNDFRLAEKIRSLRDWGRACACKICVVALDRNSKCIKRHNTKRTGLPEGYDNRYSYTSIGYNLKPLDSQCAMGIEQLKRLDQFIKIRKNNFHQLYDFFRQYEDFFILPKWPDKSEPSWFAFPLSVRSDAPFERIEIIRFLEERNIETRLIFAGNIIRHPAYAKVKIRVCTSLDNADEVMRNSFFLGVWPGITAKMMEFIKDSIDEFTAKYR